MSKTAKSAARRSRCAIPSGTTKCATLKPGRCEFSARSDRHHIPCINAPAGWIIRQYVANAITIRQDPRTPISEPPPGAMPVSRRSSTDGNHLQDLLRSRRPTEGPPTKPRRNKSTPSSGAQLRPGRRASNRDLSRMLSSIQSSCVRPSHTVIDAIEAKLKALADRLAACNRWRSGYESLGPVWAPNGNLVSRY